MNNVKMQQKLFELMKPKVGYKIFFEREKIPYTVMACDDRFFICTKPFNPNKTVLYTIIDLKEFVRGTENLIFCMGFETIEECQEALIRLQEGESEVSHRNRIALDIVMIKKPNKDQEVKECDATNDDSSNSA